MAAACKDCIALGEALPEPTDGRSPRCWQHREQRRRHIQRERQRRRRNASRPPEPYRPQRVAEVPGQRRLTTDDVGYLDGLLAEIRRLQTPINNALGQGRSVDRARLADLLTEVGALVEELDRLLWPEGPPRRKGSRRR